MTTKRHWILGGPAGFLETLVVPPFPALIALIELTTDCLKPYWHRGVRDSSLFGAALAQLPEPESSRLFLEWATDLQALMADWESVGRAHYKRALKLKEPQRTYDTLSARILLAMANVFHHHLCFLSSLTTYGGAERYRLFWEVADKQAVACFDTCFVLILKRLVCRKNVRPGLGLLTRLIMVQPAIQSLCATARADVPGELYLDPAWDPLPSARSSALDAIAERIERRVGPERYKRDVSEEEESAHGRGQKRKRRELRHAELDAAPPGTGPADRRAFDGPSVEEQVLTKFRVQELDRFLHGTLPPRQYMALHLVDISEYSYEEAAHEMGITLDGLKTNLRLGRAKLKKMQGR